MSTRLHQCATIDDQIAWTAAALRQGRSINDVSLWLSGVDRPMRVVAGAKGVLRPEGIAVGKRMIELHDAEGIPHPVLSWFVIGRASDDAHVLTACGTSDVAEHVS